jgi:cob(I)alamin adenosyltransferase
MTDDSRDTPVVLSRIYTRTGDDGTTGLADGARVQKTDPRLAAYADTDEANCAIGVAVTLGGLPDGMARLLRRIQNELFDCGADLATPLPTAPPEYPQLRIDESYVTALETACDEYNAPLPTLRSFVLPGGTAGAALLHTARAVTRRAERTAWSAVAEHGDTISAWPAKYLNRLSDLLFILARAANAADGDVLWRPGGDRLGEVAQVGSGRRGLQPRQEPGQRLVGHGQLDVLAGRRAGVIGRGRGGNLDDDPVRAEGDRVGRVRRTAGDHAERAPVEDVLGPEQHAERAVPAQRVVLVGQHAKAPRARPGGPAQGALNGPAAPLEEVAAGGEGGGGEQDQHKDGGEDPYRVRQRSPHRRSAGNRRLAELRPVRPRPAAGRART